MDAAAVPEHHPLRTAGLVVAGVVLVLGVAVAVLYVWLRSYSPLDASGSFAPGPNLAADVEPVAGSGGRPVLIPAYREGRPFDTAFTLRNTGRFAVDVTGLAAASGIKELHPVGLLATDAPDASADPAQLHPFTRLRLQHGDSAILVVRWQLDCKNSGREVFQTSVPLRYEYLSLFKRTARVALPFAVTLRCSG